MTLPKEVSEAIEDYGTSCARRGGLSLLAMATDPGTSREHLALESTILAALTEAREGALREAADWFRRNVGRLDSGGSDEAADAMLAALASRPSPGSEPARDSAWDPPAPCGGAWCWLTPDGRTWVHAGPISPCDVYPKENNHD